jgi:hypothetical protein
MHSCFEMLAAATIGQGGTANPPDQFFPSAGAGKLLLKIQWAPFFSGLA